MFLRPKMFQTYRHEELKTDISNKKYLHHLKNKCKEVVPSKFGTKLLELKKTFYYYKIYHKTKHKIQNIIKLVKVEFVFMLLLKNE